ncbi:MAG: DUF2088 domain-containing protein [Chitinispirillaceae bacterium]|jgi:hypothetical protein
MTNLHLYTVRQKFGGEACGDIEGTVAREFRRSGLQLRPGSRIALAVGSRGIANIDRIVRAAAACIREAGGVPFVVPAMGSHGGATAEGQARILAGYGISEETVGVPVVSSMEVVDLASGGLDNKVFMDRAAYEACGIVLINRIKPHTDFHGDYESGLVKMAVIGLGKHAAASELHSFGANGLRERIPATFKKIMETGKILLGLAVVENARDETGLIEAVPGKQIFEREPALLDLARRNMPSLPVEDIDVLIVDRMGKEISGVGMDPNIIGRIRIRGQKEPASPRIAMIAVSGLTLHSYGNAIGIGLADVITRRLFDAIDFTAMYVNARTSRFLERVKVPFIAGNDTDAVAVALNACGSKTQGAERVVRIRDTLHLAEVQVSKAVFDEIKNNVELVKGAENIYDEKGNLMEF